MTQNVYNNDLTYIKYKLRKYYNKLESNHDNKLQKIINKNKIYLFGTRGLFNTSISNISQITINNYINQDISNNQLCFYSSNLILKKDDEFRLCNDYDNGYDFYDPKYDSNNQSILNNKYDIHPDNLYKKATCKDTSNSQGRHHIKIIKFKCKKLIYKNIDVIFEKYGKGY
jgi:hypothetical protein